ncbi:NUDIX hydrolase [Nocardiopsis lambiniae]|uniref:NUDIX domain-containing protein n=1 Tax=Nocardiopsis lambiniae TaxID=3075539 RepID=A0ABU2M2U2_9ACTN|nr:NUDIX domain-containing protein [Nocardiopsis sp. DSM 44743]MDT0326942.1 NUDIX domain-containing protein [Nocardiopsis sp. DSM 44743]
MSNRTGDGSSTLLHSVSVAGAVIDEDGRFLVIRRADNGRSELPGGVLELAETPEDGVCREVWEETGIHVKVDRLTGVYKNTTRGASPWSFAASPSAAPNAPSPESTDVAWLTPSEVSERMGEVYAIRLLDARDPNTPHVRSHDGPRLTVRM